MFNAKNLYMNTYKGKRNVYLLIIGGLLAWFITAFLILPNLNLIYTVFFSEGSFSLSTFEKILNSERAMDSLKNSFLLAFSMIITVNVIGVFIVLVMEYFDIKGANILRLGYYTTLIYGGLIAVFGFTYIYGKNGYMTNFLTGIFPGMNDQWFIGYPAVLFVMTITGTSNYVLFLTQSVRNIDFQTIEAAKNMGASTFRILWSVVLPVLKPILIALSILVFQSGLGALAVPLVVGGEDFQTINPMILSFSQTIGSRDLAALLAIFLGLTQILLLYILTKSEKKGTYFSISKVKTKIHKQKIKNKFGNIIVHFFAYLLFAIYVLPVISIIAFSFTDAYSITTGTLSLERFTLENYMKIFMDGSVVKPFLTSVVYSALASGIVVTAILFIARLIHRYNNRLTEMLEYLLYIPWLLPSTLIALGLMMTYDVPRMIINNNVLTGTLVIMLIGYIIIKIPFTLRIIKAAYYSVDPSLEDAAKNLGAKSIYT
ncbi:ABC transporter permease [Oceanobacillus salinisoli]|uniref:ABC transporter permease n=1 Tax=Oceanobacillus salinisoli TaxID=2678611 RepID=UPI001E602A29|nr:iron ABC transporter permease [Oceanobacillus salinisoli]